MRAAAQNASLSACPKPAEVAQPHMLGLWDVRIEGQPGAVLLLQKNAQYADTFTGSIDRAGAVARVAGDVDEGVFTLEESSDGVRITALWDGEVAEGSCGREVRGSWQSTADRVNRTFVLRKQAGW